MFYEVYWWLGQPSRLHPQMTQTQVDECDVSVIALYMGHRPGNPNDPFDVPMTGDFDTDSRALIARRLAAARAEANTEGEQAGVAH